MASSLPGVSEAIVDTGLRSGTSEIKMDAVKIIRLGFTQAETSELISRPDLARSVPLLLAQTSLTDKTLKASLRSLLDRSSVTERTPLMQRR